MELLSAVLGALVVTNAAGTLSNIVEKKTGIAVNIAELTDPVEREYYNLLAMDDAAQAEVDQWILDEQKFAEKGGAALPLKGRIKSRFEPVKQAYEDFLRRHPNHARARLAYGSFLNDIQDEPAAHDQWEKARQLDPKNPAAWNNLANYYGHNGPVEKCFSYYAKAIELDPTESTYYFNLATTVYLFRHDATNYYKLTQQEVFDKAMGLYRKALELDPGNFILASDYAQSYYGFKAPGTGDAEEDRRVAQKHCDEALKAWETAFKLARDDIERQGVLVHYARLQINADRFEEARKNLNSVTNEMFSRTKGLLLKKLEGREKNVRGEKVIK